MQGARLQMVYQAIFSNRISGQQRELCWKILQLKVHSAIMPQISQGRFHQAWVKQFQSCKPRVKIESMQRIKNILQMQVVVTLLCRDFRPSTGHQLVILEVRQEVLTLLILVWFILQIDQVRKTQVEIEVRAPSIGDKSTTRVIQLNLVIHLDLKTLPQREQNPNRVYFESRYFLKHKSGPKSKKLQRKAIQILQKVEKISWTKS